MQTALIIGGSGFIGRMLCPALCAKGMRVIATARHPHPIEGAAEVLPLEITDISSVDAVFQAHIYDVVYYLAAITEHHQLVHDPITSLEAYTLGSLNIARGFSKSHASRLIYSSTGKVYAPMTAQGIPEDHPTLPSNILGQVKLIAENILSFAVRNTTQTLILARIFNVYGPHQKPTFVLPTILNQLKNGPSIELGNLDDGRDYLYAEDVVSALEILSSAPFSCGTQICNVGSGMELSVRQLLQEIENLVSLKITVIQNQNKLRHEEYLSEYADIAKLRSFGWSPKVPLRQGLHRTIEYYAPNLLS